MCAAHPEFLLNNSLEGFSRIIEVLAVRTQRARHASSQEKHPMIDHKLTQFEVGDLIWVKKDKTTGVMNYRPFESQRYGPCRTSPLSIKDAT